MADISTYSNAFFLVENVWIAIDILLNFVPKGQINNNQALVQIIWTNDKFTGEYMRHSASVV